MSMRAVVQRVLEARVEVQGAFVSEIGRGLLVYLGVSPADGTADADYLADKVCGLRVFDDAEGKLNVDCRQASGAVLVVSAFTVQADARRGRRPSFDLAARGEQANSLYMRFCSMVEQGGLICAKGEFGAYMKVHCVNDGPICVLLDSTRGF